MRGRQSSNGQRKRFTRETDEEEASQDVWAPVALRVGPVEAKATGRSGHQQRAGRGNRGIPGGDVRGLPP